MKLQTIWDKADSLYNGLAHLQTKTSRRRYNYKDDPLYMPDDFLSDEARLLSCKAFRAMQDKTQVFTFPKNAMIRTRQTHVLEVVACSVVTSSMLGLNTNLVRAAAIGHDIGHVPFGHQGEMWMAKAMGKNNFCHEVMGPIIAQKVERRGRGLNLTWHTLDAMMRHSGNNARPEMSPEAWVLRYTDKIAYLFHDYNDIFNRLMYPLPQELRGIANSFGCNQRERTTTAIAGLVIESVELGHVSFEHSELGLEFQRLRSLMYQIYPHVTQQDVGYIMQPVLDFLSLLNYADPFFLLALMTDRDVSMLAAQSMKDLAAFNQTSISEIVPNLSDIGKIDLCDPELEW